MRSHMQSQKPALEQSPFDRVIITKVGHEIHTKLAIEAAKQGIDRNILYAIIFTYVTHYSPISLSEIVNIVLTDRKP